MKLILLALFVFLSCSKIQNPFEVDEIATGIDNYYDANPTHGLAYIYEQGTGRITVYHGFNLANSSKNREGFLPWHSGEDLRVMKEEWGMNFVRLLLFWNAIEPEERMWDLEYIEGIKQVIAQCEQLGIDVVLDFHKDIYGTAFGGAGFPDWATEDENLSFEWDPALHWSDHYLKPAVMVSFQNFWNSRELKGKYLRMLRFTMLHIRDGGFSNIIGVDPMNEPFPHRIEPLAGDYLDRAFSALNDVNSIADFEEFYVGPFYEQIAQIFESSNLNYRLFFEPVISTSSGLPSDIDRGFDPAPRDVYFPHYYQRTVYNREPYPGAIDKQYLSASVKMKADKAKSLGVPLVFGEFGAEPDVPGAVEYLRDFMDLADYYGAGWAYYSYDTREHCGFAPLESDKSPNAILDALIRVYAPKIAGVKAHWKTEGSTFILRYINVGISAPTEIFIPTRLENVKITINGTSQEVVLDRGIFSYFNDGREKQEIVVEW